MINAPSSGQPVSHSKLPSGASGTGSPSLTKLTGAVLSIGPPLQRKVTLIYAKNPGQYEQIKPPRQMKASEEEEYYEEVITNEAEREQSIQLHVERVVRFAQYLESLGINVAYENQLDDQHVSSKQIWLEENVESSDFVILVITPSFRKLLSQKEVPQNETFFKGNYLNNIISGHANKSDGTPNKFVCVFLHSPYCQRYIHPSIATGNSFVLYEPFELKDGRRDDIAKFSSLMTK